MSKIKTIKARQISDSRGNPTLEARVYLESGICGWAAVPSGASKGSREAFELRDNDPEIYRGQSVIQAVSNVNTVINLALRNYHLRKCEDQREIDRILIELDGSNLKEKLGANAILAVSLAVADASSKELFGDDHLFRYIAELSEPQESLAGAVLPVPMFNVINGGEHADNKIRLQEFMIMPVGAESLWHSLTMASRVFRTIGTLIEQLPNNTSIGVGDEGGYAPMLCPEGNQTDKVRAALDLIIQAIELSECEPGKDIVLALDSAASEFYNEDTKTYDFFYAGDPSTRALTPDQLIDFYEGLLGDYPIFSIEDGMAEQDEAGWVSMTARLGKRLQLVGDDVFVTNPKIFADGIEKNIANAILIKFNQIGTLSETLETIALARRHNYNCVISHRSGETLDTKIADLSVGCATGQIKTGSISRGERVVKYNRLKDIEIDLGTEAKFAGSSILL